MLSDSRYEITEKLSVINHFANGGGNRFNSSKLNIARDFYLENLEVAGLRKLLNLKIFCLGSGPSVKSHMQPFMIISQYATNCICSLNILRFGLLNMLIID